MAAEGVEEDSVQIIDNKKREETSWSVTNTRLIIDLYRDNPVLYDNKCKDYGNPVATKKVFSPILKKVKVMTIVLLLHLVQWTEGIVPLPHQIIVLSLAIKLFNTLQGNKLHKTLITSVTLTAKAGAK